MRAMGLMDGAAETEGIDERSGAAEVSEEPRSTGPSSPVRYAPLYLLGTHDAVCTAHPMAALAGCCGYRCARGLPAFAL